jgi:DNA topoisomerase IA
MQTLANFLGDDLWQLVAADVVFLAKMETLWKSLDWENPELLDQQISEIQSLVASQIVPVEQKLAKKKSDEALKSAKIENEKNPDEKELSVEDLQNLNLRPILIKGTKISTVESKTKAIEIQLAITEDPVFSVISKNQKTEKISPKPPFITSSLQQAASNLLGMNPKITMQLAQKLYEGLEINGKMTGLITYMRTDSFALSSDSIDKCRHFLNQNYPQFLPGKPNFYKSKKSAQEAHEAIRPTNPLLDPNSIKSQLEPRLWRLYQLIWRQTISSQMTDQIRERVSFELENSQKTRFAGSTSWTTSLGWKVLQEKEEKSSE